MRLDGAFIGAGNKGTSPTMHTVVLKAPRRGGPSAGARAGGPGRACGRQGFGDAGWSDAGRWSCHTKDWNQNIGVRQRLFPRLPHCCWSIYAFCALLSLGSVVTITVIASCMQLRLHTRDFEYF